MNGKAKRSLSPLSDCMLSLSQTASTPINQPKPPRPPSLLTDPSAPFTRTKRKSA